MIQARYIAHLGDDKLVVDAARVSFAKRSAGMCEADERLIGFLARNGHWSPFSHPQVTLHVCAPIFLARQAMKSTVGFAVNEVSRRYVDSEPGVFAPETWRSRAADKKQGSAGPLKLEHQVAAADIAHGAYTAASEAYRELLDLGVAPEQARMVLPQAMETEWFWTGSLYAWARLFALRAAPDAQAEARRLAQLVSDIVGPLFPVSWEALTGQVEFGAEVAA